MKYRNYFIMFSLGVSVTTSLICTDMAIINYTLWVLPIMFLAVAYFIAILRDTLK